MIVDFNGKKLVFGLEWKALVSGGSPAALASQAANLTKAKMIWHDGRAAYVGLLSEKTTEKKRSGSLAAAAITFMRLPGLPANALLVLSLSEAHYAVVGIKDGRPRKGYDQAGLTEQEAHDLFNSFGADCGEDGFVVVGQPTPFAPDPTPLSLGELVQLADGSCALKAPSKAGMIRMLAGTAALVAVGVAFGPTYYEYINPPPPPEQQLSPAEQYQQAVAAHMADPVMQASQISGWYQWVRSLAPQYAGWRLSVVVCDFRNPTSQPSAYVAWDGRPTCTLEFQRAQKAVATNEVFMKAVPSEWLSSVAYVPTSDSIKVSLTPSLVQPGRLADFLHAAPQGRISDVEFVSQLQKASNLAQTATLSAPAPFLMPPGLPPGSVPGAYMASRWQLVAPLHLTELLSSFPSFVAVYSAKLDLADAEKSKQPYQVTLEGIAFTHN